MRKIYNTFTKDVLHEEDIVVYLKNEKTGSSTIRKCKFIGCVVGFTGTKVKINRLSPPDIFVTPEDCKNLGIDTVLPEEVVHIIISKYQEDDHIKTTKELCRIIDKYRYEHEANKKELINWLLDEKYAIDEFDTNMTEEFEKEHQWELSRNCFINKTVKYIEDSNSFK